MTTKPRQQVVITIDDAHLSSIDAVRKALSAAGLSDIRAMPIAGIVTGRIAESKIKKLKAVEGVVAVEADSEMRAI